MKLEAYLVQKKLTDAEFALKVGLSRSMVTRLRNGLARPSASSALRIQKATNGKVTLSDMWLDSARSLATQEGAA